MSVEQRELFEALDGLMAYDLGATDSGIHDEILRQQVINYLQEIPRADRNVLLARFVGQRYVSEEAIQRGCGIEDVVEFLDWLDEYMTIHIRR